MLTDLLTQFRKRLARWHDSLIVDEEHINYSSKPMTETQRAAFNAAFAKMDEAFKELGKAFDRD